MPATAKKFGVTRCWSTSNGGPGAASGADTFVVIQAPLIIPNSGRLAPVDTATSATPGTRRNRSTTSSTVVLNGTRGVRPMS